MPDKINVENMNEHDLLVLLNKMVQTIYNKTYYEMFNCEINDKVELINNYRTLERQYFIALGNDKEEKQDEVKIEKADTFHDVWMNLWKKQIHLQDDVGELYCLTVASQMFRHVKIQRNQVEDDIRIHPCVIMPSGTGKSEGNTFTANFCKRCPSVNLNCALPEEFSNSTMIGTFNSSKYQYNLSSKLQPGDEEYLDPNRLGLLGTHNFIMFDEGENILKPSQRAEGIQRILQHAMNRHGSETNLVTNDLVNSTIECQPNCSIAITSYYLNEFKTTLLDRGLLQRMVIIIKSPYEINRRAIEKFILDNTDTIKDGESIEDFNKRRNVKYDNIDHLYKKLNKLAGELLLKHQETSFIYMKEDAKAAIEEHKDIIREIVPNLTSHQMDIWETMVSRLTPMFIKISALYALLDGRNYVEVQDVLKAYKVLESSMRGVVFFLMDKVASTEISDGTTNIYNRVVVKMRNKKLTEENWVSELISMFGMSASKAQTVVKDLKLANKLKLRKSLTDPNLRLLELV